MGSHTEFATGSVYDAAANCNIERKANILRFEKQNIIPGKYSLKGFQATNK